MDVQSKYRVNAEWHHSSGFPVYVEQGRADEYADGNPYRAEEELSNDFNQRRIDLTTVLLQDAVARLNTNRTVRILDIGCGQGHITERIRQKLPNADFSALDYSVAAITYAKSHFPEIDFIVADALCPPYADAYFDVVVCNNLWEHVPNPLTLLDEMGRMLKPHGYVIISTPSRYSTSNLVHAIFGRPVAFMSPLHVTEYTVGQVHEQLRWGGFEVVRMADKPIREGWKRTAARLVFSAWIKMVGARHSLSETVFYLAQKNR